MAPKRKAPAAKKAAPKKKTKAEQAAAASPTEPDTSTAQSVTADQQGAVLRPHSCSPCTQAACQHARLRPHSLPSRRPYSALALT